MPPVDEDFDEECINEDEDLWDQYPALPGSPYEEEERRKNSETKDLTEEEIAERAEVERLAAEEQARREADEKADEEREAKAQAERNRDRKIPVTEDFDEDCIQLDEDTWEDYIQNSDDD